MKYRWLDKNVTLELLAQKIEDFFKKRGFKVRLDKETPSKYIVYIIISHEKGRRIATAKIYGKPNDFFVEFPDENHSLINFGSFMSMFGGGFLVLKEIKNKELLGNLEDEFWIYMEKVIEAISEKS